MTAAQGKRPVRLGVVLLDGPRYERAFGCFEPEDEMGLTSSQPGFFGHPATWSVPTAYAVAQGATAAATLSASKEAAAGLGAATERLEDVADLITSDCGFFWSVSRRGDVRSGVPLLLSGIDLLELASSVASGPIGVLSYSKVQAEQMLADHWLGDRLRVVGFSDQPAWLTLAPEHCDRPDWSVARLDRDALAADVVRVVAAELDGGVLRGVGALVIECTVIPQFRHLLRRLTRVPIFDVASACHALLVGPGGETHQFRLEGRAKVVSG